MHWMNIQLFFFFCGSAYTCMCVMSESWVVNPCTECIWDKNLLRADCWTESANEIKSDSLGGWCMLYVVYTIWMVNMYLVPKIERRWLGSLIFYRRLEWKTFRAWAILPFCRLPSQTVDNYCTKLSHLKCTSGTGVRLMVYMFWATHNRSECFSWYFIDFCCCCSNVIFVGFSMFI